MMMQSVAARRRAFEADVVAALQKENVMRKPMIVGYRLWTRVAHRRSASAQLAEKKVITLAAARKMVAAAEAEAERNHWAGVIAVVDDGGWLNSR